MFSKEGWLHASLSPPLDLRLLFAYNMGVPLRHCRVALTDVEGVTHTVTVEAESLMEAIALAMQVLRASGFQPVRLGPGSPIAVTVKSAAEAEHSVTYRQFESWLTGVARSPKERLLKDRLRSAASD